MRRLISLLIAFSLFGLAVAGLATTWGNSPTPCGLCGKTVQMESIMSYGSYIYGWPSKYQLIFWPVTEERSVYYCKHCGFAAFMGDFQKIPKEKQEAIKKAIAPLVEKHTEKNYYEIPMSYRLKIAEAVYQQLGRDDNFWCRFHRILGYHLDKAGQAEAAKAARLKALSYAEKMLEAGKKSPPRKEVVFIIGSMQYFTGQKDKAKETLARVAKTPVKVPEEMDQEAAKNTTQYLDELAGDFIKLIEAGKKPPQ